MVALHPNFAQTGAAELGATLIMAIDTCADKNADPPYWFPVLVFHRTLPIAFALVIFTLNYLGQLWWYGRPRRLSFLWWVLFVYAYRTLFVMLAALFLAPQALRGHLSQLFLSWFLAVPDTLSGRSSDLNMCCCGAISAVRPPWPLFY